MSNSVSTLDGLFKERYADQVTELVPDHVKLYNDVKFESSKKQGDSYNEPVVLSLESGFSYGGEEGDLFDLADAQQFKMKNAKVRATELVLRSAISYGALNRSKGNDQAIEKAMDLMVGNMLKSVYHRLEVQMFYGREGIGVVSADIAGGAPSEAVTIEQTEWAAGIWNGTSNARVEVFSADLATKRGEYIIEGYSLADRSVTLKALSGNLAAAEIVATDVIYFKGAASTSTLNEFRGIHNIAQESTSLFGIANAAEPLFQGSVVNVGADINNLAVISLEKVEEGIAKMVEKGLLESDVDLYVNPKQWKTLLTEQDAKRQYDSSYGEEAKAGHKKLKFYGQNGGINVMASTFVKEGYAYIVNTKDLKRIGSTEVTFKRPDGDSFLQQIPTKNGIEMRCYTDQSLFTARPASICILQYIQTDA